MAILKSRALVLRSHRLGETSKVVVCYTEAYGKVRLVAKGGRKGGSRLGAALEPFVVSGVVFYLKAGRDLSIVSQAEVERDFSGLRRDVVRMAYGAAVLELVDQVVSGQEPDPGLFAVIVETLEELESADRASLDLSLVRFGFRMAGALGYEAAFTSCVLCAGTPGSAALFAPRLGGLVCEACLSRHPEVEVARRQATAVLAEAAAGKPSASVVGAVLADELWGALRAFLVEHTGRSIRLRSLDVLAQLRRAEQE
jgi:DNA repair protein RecO (recombination protein O)